MRRNARWNMIIRRPGKFEGEPVAVRYYWNTDSEDELIINEFDEQYRIFRDVINDEAYPHLALYETGNGFVYHELVNDNRLGQLEAGIN